MGTREATRQRLVEARQVAHRGDYATARQTCQDVLRRDRRNVDALLLLAEIEHHLGQMKQAAQLMSRVVQAEPKNTKYRVQLAQLYAASGEYARAHDQFDRVLKLAPGYTWAVGDKAAVYERQDRYPEALRLLETVARKQVAPPEVAAVYLRVLVHEGHVDEAVRVGRSVVEHGFPEGMRLRDTWFALAKALELSELYDEALGAAARGNALFAAPFSPAEHEAKIDRLIATFTRERLASLPRPTQGSELPVFIVGIPRTGSTLVERVIHAHPLAFGADEHAGFFRLVDELPERVGTGPPYPQCIDALTTEHVDAMAKEYVEEMQRLSPSATRITNKDLGNYLHLGLIQTVFPNAKVIHCRRDPLDTCLSCFMERLIPGAVPYAGDLTHLGVVYRSYQRLMQHWADVLDLAVLDVQYEELIADQARVSRRVIEFCGLDWDDACMRFHEVDRSDRTLSYDQVRRPLYSSSVGRADRFGAALDPLRAALAG